MSESTQKFSVGSLFSGIGGIELGLERTRQFETKWVCEIEPYPSAVLAERFPNSPNLKDITKVQWENVPPVDVLTGGFPCQDISNAGKRKGITGERSGLWKEYLKAIRILQPRIVLIENVAALLNRGLTTVLADLTESGYDAEWQIVSARDVGAPHLRKRIFIVAYPNSERLEEHSESGRTQFSYSYSGDVETHRRPSSLTEVFSSRKGQLDAFRQSIGRNQWEAEPDVGRMVNGVSKGLDSYLWRERIKSLGNGVVPQVAQYVGETMILPKLRGTQ